MTQDYPEQNVYAFPKKQISCFSPGTRASWIAKRSMHPTQSSAQGRKHISAVEPSHLALMLQGSDILRGPLKEQCLANSKSTVTGSRNKPTGSVYQVVLVGK